MKKIIYVLLGVFAVAFASCEKETVGAGSADTEEVTFMLAVASESSGKGFAATALTRGEGENVNRYIMEVWDEGGTAEVYCFGADFNSHRSTNQDGKFTVTLDNTQKYTILFWADNDSDKTYDASSLKAVKLNTDKSVISASYFAKHTGQVKANNPIPLQRAVAEVRLMETGGNVPTFSVMVAYTGYSAFDVSKEGVATANTHDFTHLIPTSEYGTVGGVGGKARLGSFLAFASKAASSINLTLTESFTVRAKTLNDVQLTANEITNLNGHYFDAITSDVVPIIMRTIGGNIKIDFFAPSSWSVEVAGGAGSWCTIGTQENTNGVTASSFIITAKGQASSAARMETITITSGSWKQKLSVTQRECALLGSSSNQFIVNDRNLGGEVPVTGEALFYTNAPNSTNPKFKGLQYDWDNAVKACYLDEYGNTTTSEKRIWRLPNEAEIKVINTALKFDNNEPHLISKASVKSYFPLAGDDGSTEVRGYYWSSLANSSYYAYILRVDLSSSIVTYTNQTLLLSVRCIKTVTE